MIRVITSGESHGRAVSVIVEGLPAGLVIEPAFINHELRRRQHGYGRGERMRIEQDRVEFLAGVRFKKTIGSPIHMIVFNDDHKNWQKAMAVSKDQKNVDKIEAPRPGHADLAGVLKYNFDDTRNVLERASARETSGRVMAGALFKMLLKHFGVEFYSHTTAIGAVSIDPQRVKRERIKDSPLYCADQKAEQKMIQLIDQVKNEGDTIGGISEVIATGVCPGLGSYQQYDRRLDGLIGQAMLSIPSVKGVEIGPAFANTRKLGSQVQDEIFYEEKKGFYRLTNRAGGMEGGVSNGTDIIVRLAVKPIPSLSKPLRSVNIRTKQSCQAQKERADVCVVPAVGVIGEAMLAMVIARVFIEKFGGDTLEEMRTSYHRYLKGLQNV